MHAPVIDRGHNGRVRIHCAPPQQTIGMSALTNATPKRLRRMRWHAGQVPQPVNAAEPHQQEARNLLSSDRTCATCHSSYKTPLLSEIALATVAQCRSCRLDEPEVLVYPTVLQHIVAKQRRRMRRYALIELQRPISCCI
jgi:hypothetical protein